MRSLAWTISIACFFTLFFFTACSKCYTCKSERTYESGGVTITDTLEEDGICTADPKEIDDREAAGADCTAE
ncbi:MAG: hypothetical protein MRY83_21765 [Flavobacteriales bacterium]|nr:hypothetical protein [Flavobacteriales bacterium]